MTRGDLIALCEAAIRPESVWHNRDSAGAQKQVGEAWALLKAGCDFWVDPDFGGRPDEGKTIWLRIRNRGFQAFELGDEGIAEDLFYIPTRKRLDKAGERDWY